MLLKQLMLKDLASWQCRELWYLIDLTCGLIWRQK